MKKISFLTLALATTLAMVGCEQMKALAPKDPAATTEAPATATAAPVTTVEEWLKQAPAPATVACSLSADTAPDAVEKFNAISEKVSAIYSAVYTYAQSDDTVTTPTIDAQTIGAALETAMAEKAAGDNTSIVDKVTAQYRATMAEIEGQQAAITDYITSLRTSPSITAIADPAQKTATLFQLGANVKQLEEQLVEAAQGAALILRERVPSSEEK